MPWRRTYAHIRARRLRPETLRQAARRLAACGAPVAACLFAGAAFGQAIAPRVEAIVPDVAIDAALPNCEVLKQCVPGTVLGILPDVPPDLAKFLAATENPAELLGLVYREAAALSQVVGNVGSIAAGLTQDVTTNVLDVALEPDAAAALGPASTGPLGASSSAFMVSGYKHLSHDGFSVSSDFAAASGKGPEFDQDEYGLTLGTRFDGGALFDTEKGVVTLGVLGNYTHTDIDVGAAPDAPGNFKSGAVSIESWSAGGYGLVTDGTRYALVTVSGTFGSPETENARVASSAGYDTFGFAASAISGVLVPIGGAKLDLRGGLNYVHASSDDYTDSIGSRYTDARLEELSGTLSARLFTTMRFGDYSVRPFVQGGVNQRFSYDNEITIDNAKFSFDDADTSIFGRTGIDFDVDKAVQAYLAVRGDASDDFTSIAAQVGVTLKLD